MSEKLKRIAAQQLKECFEIAEQLYNSNRERYKPIYEFIHSSVKQRKPIPIILRCVRSLAERETGGADRPPNPVADVRSYLGGTLRKLEEEAGSKGLRRGEGPSLLGDILNRAQERSRGNSFPSHLTGEGQREGEK